MATRDRAAYSSSLNVAVRRTLKPNSYLNNDLHVNTNRWREILRSFGCTNAVHNRARKSLHPAVRCLEGVLSQRTVASIMYRAAQRCAGERQSLLFALGPKEENQAIAGAPKGIMLYIK